MTISSEITKLQTNLADSYTACSGKGATMPTNQNFDNLPTCINSIQTGGGSFIGIPREVSAAGVYQAPTTSFSFSLPSNATDISSYGMYYAFYASSGITSADLSSLTTVTGSNSFNSAFRSCSRLTSVDLSSLTTVTGLNSFSAAFNSCSNLVSVDLSSLTTVTGSNAFGTAFNNCRRLSSLSFPSLNSSSFGNNTNQFNFMLSGVTGCTVHFPSNLQSVIGSWSSVTSGFSGTNTVVLFDLPATT